MSIADSRLNFYIIKLDMESYNLYNSNTDKKVLSNKSEEEIRDFLGLNDPDHPFLFFYKEPYEGEHTWPLSKAGQKISDRVMSRAKRGEEYGLCDYDPYFYTSLLNPSYHSYDTGDFTVSYDIDNDRQLSFSFMSEQAPLPSTINDADNKSVDKNSEGIKDNVLPFLPDSEWDLSEED